MQKIHRLKEQTHKDRGNTVKQVTYVPLCDSINPVSDVLPQKVIGSGKGLSHISCLVNLTLVGGNVCLELLMFLEETLHRGEVPPVVLRLKLGFSVINPGLEVIKRTVE